MVLANSRHRESAELYLARHGQHVTGLELHFLMRDGPVTQLPCANLQRLELYDCTVQLGPSSEQPGILQVCTNRTQLVLSSCSVSVHEVSFSALAVLPKLRHLHLQGCSEPLGLLEKTPSMSSSLLLHLPQLTYFSVCAVVGRHIQECLQQLSSLSCLQTLSIGLYGGYG